MSEQRTCLRLFLDDGQPEACDYDTSYLIVGIDPVLHPSWRAHSDGPVRWNERLTQLLRLGTSLSRPVDWLRRRVARVVAAFA